VAIGVFAAGSCARSAAREYELEGQVLAIDRARQEITIKHGDIPRFMPGMTMPFKVRDATLLADRVPGDLVRATLVVEGAEPHLRTLRRIGHAPIPASTPLPTPPNSLAVGHPVDDLTLVDDTGASRRISDWRGRAIAVTFVYTRCPVATFCPLMDRQFKAVQDQVGSNDDLRGRVQLLSVSIDPDHDTPPVLARHAAALHADPSIWRFLTGARADVERFGAQFGVTVLPEESGTGIVHNLRTAVIDPGGKLATVLNGGEWTPADLIEELRRALRPASEHAQ
jgi:protein SCO1/2